MSEKSLASVLRRVQQFISKAEAPNYSPPGSPEWEATDTEQKSARQMADALMLEYAVEEAMLEAAKPSEMRIKPLVEEFATIGDMNLRLYIMELARTVASYTRCKIRDYARYDREEGLYYAKVYGYESDVRYFMFLYTTLRLHFIGALLPKVDPSLSLDENCYRLHNAGWNWRGIAAMYGWRKWSDVPYEEKQVLREHNLENPDAMTEPWVGKDGVLEEGKRMAIVYKRACRRACKARGEEMLLHINPDTFRRSAAVGYRDQIRTRLVEQEMRRGSSNALAIRIDDLEQFYREENATHYHRCPACQKLSLYAYQCDVCGNTEGMAPKPEAAKPCPKCAVNPSGTCREHPAYSGRWRAAPFSEAGYSAGTRQASTADISGRNVGHTTRAVEG